MRVWMLALAALPLCGQARFVDVTREAGIVFKHNAAKGGRKLLPETMGAGCAFVDLNGDERPDVRERPPAGDKIEGVVPGGGEPHRVLDAPVAADANDAVTVFELEMADPR